MEKRDITVRISQAAIGLLQSASPGEMAKKITDYGRDIAGADYGSLVVSRDEKLIRLYSTDKKLHKIPVKKSGLAETALKKEQAFCLAGEELRRDRKKLWAFGIRMILVLPMVYNQSSNGVLYLYFKEPRELATNEIRHMTLFASFCSLAVKNSVAMQEMRQAAENQDLFLNHAAHELRTPLTAINGYTQLLSKRLAQSGDGDLHIWAKSLYGETLRLSALIDELLEIGRLRSGHVSFFYEETSLCDLVNKIKETLGDTYPERNIDFDVSADCNDKVIVDPKKLSQAIEALLENALRYSKKQVEIKVFNVHPQYVVLSITDYGSGMTAQQIEDARKGIYKGKSSDDRGFGLGIFMANKIVEKHNGQLFFAPNKRGDGTTAEIRLPKILL